MLHTLRKGRHGQEVLLVAATLLVMAAALLVGLVAPAVWPAAVSFALVALGGIAFLALTVLTRLRAAIDDTRCFVSVHAGLNAAGWVIPDLFMDGAAGSPSLQLFHFKVLRLIQPQSVLEIGSGQTTKLLSAYAAGHPTAKVLTIEQDEAWWSRAKADVRHDFRHAALEERRLSVPEARLEITTPWYKDIPDLRERKFDYVLVDGPDYGTGGGYVPYARSGILAYMPALLADSFVVVFDDAERAGEIMTIDAFETLLRARSVPYRRFALHGVKNQVVFCSPSWSFLRSV